LQKPQLNDSGKRYKERRKKHKKNNPDECGVVIQQWAKRAADVHSTRAVF